MGFYLTPRDILSVLTQSGSCLLGSTTSKHAQKVSFGGT